MENLEAIILVIMATHSLVRLHLHRGGVASRARRTMRRVMTHHISLLHQLLPDICPDSETRLIAEELNAGPHRFWSRQITQDWWERVVLETWDPDQWLQNFRMTKDTFLELCEELRPELHRQTTSMRAPLSVEKRVGIGLWKLATTECYRSVADRFGVGRSTVGEVFIEVCLAIEKLLLKKMVALKEPEEVMAGFAEMGFPNCVGIMDRTHIPILCTVRKGTSISQKGFFPMLLQGTMDHKGRFINIELSWCGKDGNASFFRNLMLYDAMDQGSFVPGNPTVTIDDVAIPPLILGDVFCPLKKWLMTPFTDNLDPSKELFNSRLNDCKKVAELAFGRLKGRWKCLATRLEVAEENIIPVVVGCVVLHNLCESRGHVLVDEPLPQDQAALDQAPEGQLTFPIYPEDAQDGNLVRETLANYFMNNS
ncbi:protein ANTAGONIST OF LIKE HETEROCHROMATIN PROTEIN 1-like [Sceloporus undulatus]|uniref:protein ANTAGONIST OF LIKE HETEROCHROMATIN PROTEIN 1-like n=1 Tax=Sceloporus undulatus TaxID=8520 RepID=UPI001C4D9C1E|nr:protein ANTAGONIST OF LIKE HETEROCHROMATIN PROTEIN 1-like [Sceloporus undulatus]XP_042306735.1 protein ANTAGONIST OF LIKE HETEROCHROMATIN PROTEIN 1-like [Sceloporus undulatus]